MLDKGLDKEKSAKKPGTGRGVENPGAIVRVAFPPASPREPRAQRPCFPRRDFHDCGKVLWKRMAIAFSEQEAREAWANACRAAA